MLCFVCHLFACLWGLQASFDPLGTWLGAKGYCMPFDPATEVCEEGKRCDNVQGWSCAPAGTTYLYSLYWSIATVTSIGYGDILPTNRSEHLLCVVFMLIGASFWAYIIGSACSILASLNVDTLAFRQNMDHLNYFIHDQKISFSMAKELRALFLKSRSLQRINNYKHLYTCCCCYCCCYCALQLPCSPTPQLALATALPGTTACRRSCAGASHCTAPPGWSRRCITSRTATKASWL